MAVPQISPLPEAPSRADDGNTFATKADTFVAQLPLFGAQANEVATYVNQRVSDAEAAGLADAASNASSASAAASAATEAALEAQAAAAAVTDTVVAHGDTGATETFDAGVSSYHSATLDDDCEFTFANPKPAGRHTELILYIAQDDTGGHTITWPASATGQGGGGVEAGSSSANAVDIWVATTIDGGATWYVVLALKGESGA